VLPSALQDAFADGAAAALQKATPLSEADVNQGIAEALYANALAFYVTENHYFRSSYAKAAEWGFESGLKEGMKLGIEAAVKSFKTNKVVLTGSDSVANQLILATDELKACAKTLDFQMPHQDAFRTTYLDKTVKDVVEYENQMLKAMQNEAQTLVSDGWRDAMYDSLEQINMVLLLRMAALFGQPVYATEKQKTGEYLAKMIVEAIRTFQARGANIRFSITDGAYNCVAAQPIIMTECPGVFALTCACHGLDLLMEDLGKNIPFFKDTLELGMEVITYITRHDWVLVQFKKFADLKLMKPAKTRFAYAFIVLYRFLEDRDAITKLFAAVEHRTCVSFAFHSHFLLLLEL
jgi:hypothetical protein